LHSSRAQSLWLAQYPQQTCQSPNRDPRLTSIGRRINFVSSFKVLTPVNTVNCSGPSSSQGAHQQSSELSAFDNMDG
jgi:hypothetical protein